MQLLGVIEAIRKLRKLDRSTLCPISKIYVRYRNYVMVQEGKGTYWWQIYHGFHKEKVESGLLREERFNKYGGRPCRG